MVRKSTKNPIKIFNCIPMANIFICGATFAIIPRIQFNIIITTKTGRMIRKAITNRSVIYIKKELNRCSQSKTCPFTGINS